MKMEKRMKFSSDGKLIGVDNLLLESFPSDSNTKNIINNEEIFESIFDNSSWSLYENKIKLEPLRFSNGKTQEDVVKEIIDLIKSGNKVIFLHGVCGTGKSAIALNIARQLGKTAIVVPIKSLQKQYEEDYTSKKYLLKPSGKKMKISLITGRDNHDSIIKPGVSCADPFLPDTISLAEKNRDKIVSYYNQNPFISQKINPNIRKLKRISIAPANPYWSPIRDAMFELNQLTDAKKKRYRGIFGREFIFYHRKQGCTYYDQYQSYIDADVLIFNAAKYKIEMTMLRKPETEVDIIDEADEFLDSFSNEDTINLTRLNGALNSLSPEFEEAKNAIDKIQVLTSLEEKKRSALGINTKEIYPLKDTHILKILQIFLKNAELQAEIALDEMSYLNNVLETAYDFEHLFDDAYVTYERRERELHAHLITTNLAEKFSELMDKTKALVLMSGTLHSESVLKNVFGINNYKIVEAETALPGTAEIIMTGKEIDCKYKNFTDKKYSREDYLRAFESCMNRVHNPTLIHVNAFDDLPNKNECELYGISNIMQKEKLLSLQLEDKTGRAIALFKQKLSDMLFTTKCSRGIDFPGDICNSVVFTKYPNANINDVFWKVLKKTHASYFSDFYQDKSRRELLQRLYRALRSKDDHVFVLSPDSRVLDAVRGLQKKKNSFE